MAKKRLPPRPARPLEPLRPGRMVLLGRYILLPGSPPNSITIEVKPGMANMFNAITLHQIGQRVYAESAWPISVAIDISVFRDLNHAVLSTFGFDRDEVVFRVTNGWARYKRMPGSETNQRVWHGRLVECDFDPPPYHVVAADAINSEQKAPV